MITVTKSYGNANIENTNTQAHILESSGPLIEKMTDNKSASTATYFSRLNFSLLLGRYLNNY